MVLPPRHSTREDGCCAAWIVEEIHSHAKLAGEGATEISGTLSSLKEPANSDKLRATK